MVKLMQNVFEAEKAYEFDEVLGARIYTLYNCYDNDYNFLKLWVAYNGDDITACISIMSGLATITASENCNFEELAFFFGNDATIDTIEINIKTGKILNSYLNYHYKTRPIMKYKGVFREFTPKYNIYTNVIKDTFSILRDSDEDFKNADFGSWLYDIHRRTHHNFAKLFAAKDITTDQFVSVGGYYISSPVSAVLGGVSTLPQYRKKGFASDVVRCVTEDILNQNKNCFLIAANDDLIIFYNNLGYEETDREMLIATKQD